MARIRRTKSMEDIIAQSGRLGKRLYHGESGAQSTDRMRRVAEISKRYTSNILKNSRNKNKTFFDYFMNTSNSLKRKTFTRQRSQSYYMGTVNG